MEREVEQDWGYGVVMGRLTVGAEDALISKG